MEQEIFEVIRNILKDDFHLYNVEFNTTSNIRNDFGLDSLDVMEILIKLEEKYNIHISYTDSDAVQTVQDIIDVVCNKLNCVPK